MNSIYIDFLTKFLIGGSLVISITFIAKYFNAQAAALIVFIPAVSLVSYYFIGLELGKDELKQVVFFSLWSILLLLIFVISLIISLKYFGVFSSILISMVIWILSTAIIYQFIKN